MPLTVLNVSYPLAKVSAGTPGGAEQVLTTIDKELVRQGHKSLVLAPEGSRCAGLLIPAKIPSGILDEVAKREARRAFKRLLDRTLVRFPVDVIHMHGIDFHEYLPSGEVPVVVSLHLPLDWYHPEAICGDAANLALVSVSELQARTALPSCRVDCVIPNGVDLDEFRPTQKRGNYALAMGRFCPEKGFHLAIDAVESAECRGGPPGPPRGSRLLLAGSVFEYPEHRSYFDQMIAPRLNDRIRFIGPVGGERKRHLLAGARCLLIPSQVEETSSLLAMEAMACGTPVIAWRSGALPQVVKHGKTGFLVSSVEEMAEAISRAHEIDGAECRREAEQRFGAREMVSKYLRLYESMVSRSSLRELQAA